MAVRKVRPVGITLAAVVTAGTGVAGTSTAYADGAWGRITSRWIGKCMDMRSEDGSGNGVPAQQ